MKEDSNKIAIIGTFTVVIIYVTSKVLVKYIQSSYETEKKILDDLKAKRSLLHEKIPKKLKLDTKEDSVDIIIIGSGMSGLSCASVLARLGRSVIVLEQHNDVVGGGTHTFDLKGYRFDSGLHYTVPWSVPIFALTCGVKPKHVTPFDLLMCLSDPNTDPNTDGTIDKINIVSPNEYTSVAHTNTSQTSAASSPTAKSFEFKMKYREQHLAELHRMFPNEKAAIEKYLDIASDAMAFVKAFIFARLLPKCLQEGVYWNMLVPKRLIDSAAVTASELLPKLSSNKLLNSLLSSMWIDTGARPDRASFMLTASVFRGISMEGGCYPRGGSSCMAKELVSVVKRNGGKVYVRAKVGGITFDDGTQRVSGVRLVDGRTLRCKRAVVSSCGYINTMKHLLPHQVTQRFGYPLELPGGLTQSAGFVMCNIGINASASAIGAYCNSNTWHIPVDAQGDAFACISKYFEDPLHPDTEIPVFITFPSLKDKQWSAKHPNSTSCQILVMANYDWFSEFKQRNYNTIDIDVNIKYEKFKKLWEEKCLRIFLRYFPKALGLIELVDVSTPLTIEHYLNAPLGAAVGLDVTPQRFVDKEIRTLLDPVTNIPGLYLTGQDTLLCGVTLCQLAGVITAMRMEGFLASMKILLYSILLGD